MIMAKESASKRKNESGTSKAVNVQVPTLQQEQHSPLTTSAEAKKSSKEREKAVNKSRIGGTAVPGAKSTLPKPPPTTTNNGQQQAESYNRDMRRRMQHLGTGPYAEREKTQALQDQRKKRLERRKQRLEERREDLRKSLPAGKLSLGRKNFYFVIAVTVLVVLLIVVFAILRATHVI